MVLEIGRTMMDPFRPSFNHSPYHTPMDYHSGDVSTEPGQFLTDTFAYGHLDIRTVSHTGSLTSGHLHTRTLSHAQFHMAIFTHFIVNPVGS